MSVKLRDFQERAFNEILALIRQRAIDIRLGKASRQLRILVVAPCGSGKGTLISYLIKRAAAKKRAVQFWVNRRNLVNDMSKRLTALDLEHGVLMGNDPRAKPWLTTFVCSADTLRNRPATKVDLVGLDECHFSLSPTYQRLINNLPPHVVVIGLTATPILLNGDGLGRTYDVMVEMPKQSELVRRGYLTPTITFGTGELPDFEGIKMTGGDINCDAASARCNKPKLLGDIVTTWRKLCPGWPTVAFGANRDHAYGIMKAFVEAGIPAAYVDANSPDSLREQCDRDLASGVLKVECNVGITSYGWDVPEVACVIGGRRTMSLPIFIQSNRATRITPGKTKAIYLDHTGNTQSHGWIDEDREWSLGYDEDRMKRPSLEEREEACRICLKCGYNMNSAEITCPQCGAALTKRVKKIEVQAGELVEMKPPCVCSKCKRRMEDSTAGDVCECGGSARRAYVIDKLSSNPEIAALQRIAQERQYQSGWLFMQMKKLKQGRSERGFGELSRRVS